MVELKSMTGIISQPKQLQSNVHDVVRVKSGYKSSCHIYAPDGFYRV